MDERLKRLQELRAEAAAKVEALEAERKAITDKLLEEERADLTEDEDKEFWAKTDEIRAEQDRIDNLDAQIKKLEEERERAGRQNKDAQEVARAQAQVKVTNEPKPYERRNGFSYFQDLAKKSVNMADFDAEERLRRHAISVEKDAEYAEVRALDRTDGSGGYFVPPAWLMSQAVELARAGRAYANLVPSQPLPPGTDSINVPKILTGTATAIQTADNATIQETDLTDTSVQANVKTIAGQQTLAIQLLDQSPVAFDEIVFRDLMADYATKLDLQVISGSGSAGQVVGVRNTPSIETVTATSGSNNVQLLYAKIADAVQRVHTQRFMSPEVIVMHPRRWAYFLAAVDSTGRPLVVPNGPGQNQIGAFGSVASEQVVGQMHGLPVVTDPNLPTTLGTGTNQDVIHVLRASDLVLYESSIRSRALPEVASSTLSVRLQVYGYLAFTAGRFPKSVVEIGGTALSTPAFS